MKTLPALLTIIFLWPGILLAFGNDTVPMPGDSNRSQYTTISYNPEIQNLTDTFKIKLSLSDILWLKLSKLIPASNKDKLTAIILALLTGPLGGHRIFLGTKPLIPVFYVLTLGGGLGILPFIDFVILCFARDIAPYENNQKFFMWAN